MSLRSDDEVDEKQRLEELSEYAKYVPMKKRTIIAAILMLVFGSVSRGSVDSDTAPKVDLQFRIGGLRELDQRRACVVLSVYNISGEVVEIGGGWTCIEHEPSPVYVVAWKSIEVIKSRESARKFQNPETRFNPPRSWGSFALVPVTTTVEADGSTGASPSLSDPDVRVGIFVPRSIYDEIADDVADSGHETILRIELTRFRLNDDRRGFSPAGSLIGDVEGFDSGFR